MEKLTWDRMADEDTIRMKYNPCPKDREFYEKHYVKLEKSSYKIAKEFNLCANVVWKRVKSFGLNRNYNESAKDRIGVKNHNWKGDKISYDALHDYITRHKFKPALCEECGKRKPEEIANVSGKYKRNVKDFRWLCIPCHRNQDRESKHNKFLSSKVKNGLFRCSICKIYKPKKDFYNHKGNLFNIRCECKECTKKQANSNK